MIPGRHNRDFTLSLLGLDHYTINVASLRASVEFYEAVLGLTAGPRPEFPFPGAWLYLGDKPIVHLVAESGKAEDGSGTVDHIAFRAEDRPAYRQRIDRANIQFEERMISAVSLSQIFLSDPDGILIELNFWNETA